jgi:hypothetical protein
MNVKKRKGDNLLTSPTVKGDVRVRVDVDATRKLANNLQQTLGVFDSTRRPVLLFIDLFNGNLATAVRHIFVQE